VNGLNRLRDVLGVYEAGTWFRLDSRVCGINNSKLRPVVIIEKWKAGNNVIRARVRSASSWSGHIHEAHPNGHEPACCVKQDGRISYEYCVVGKQFICSDYYSCKEPDPEALSMLCMDYE